MDLSLIYHWINFSVFVFLLFYFLKEPLLDFLGDRRENLRKEMEEVSHIKKEIELKLRETQSKLAKVDLEIEKLMNELKEEGKREKQILIQKAQEFAVRMKEDTKRIGEQESRRIATQLKQKGMRVALEVAKENLKKAVENKDQERLLLWGIEHLKSGDPKISAQGLKI